MGRTWLPALLGMLMAAVGAGLLVAFYPHGPHWCSVATATGRHTTLDHCAPRIIALFVGVALIAGGIVVTVGSLVAGLRSVVRRRNVGR